MSTLSYSRRDWIKLSNALLGFTGLSAIPGKRAHGSTNVERVAVVGAGIAGLTAAYYLRKSGINAEVFEAGDYVGGRMSTEAVGDRFMDRGAQILSPNYLTLMALVDELGLNEQLIEITPFSSIIRNGTPRRVNTLDFKTLVTNGLLRPWEFNPLGLFAFLNLARSRRPLNDITKWAEEDIESAEEWARKNFGEKFHDFVGNPMLGLTFHASEEVSRIRLMWILSFFHRSDRILSMKDGLGSIPAALARRVPVHLNRPVYSVTQDPDGALLEMEDGVRRFDRVIIAAPAPAAAQIYRPQCEEEEAILSNPYKSVINLSFETARRWQTRTRLERDFALIVPPKEQQLITATTFEFRPHADRTRELFQVFIQRDARSPEYRMPTAELLQQSVAELERHFPGINASILPESVRAFRWLHGTPGQPVGWCEVVQRYRDMIDGNPPKVLLAGDYTGFYGTDGAAATGILAALAALDS